jgi:hypothetical protein
MEDALAATLASSYVHSSISCYLPAPVRSYFTTYLPYLPTSLSVRGNAGRRSGVARSLALLPYETDLRAHSKIDKTRLSDQQGRVDHANTIMAD